MTKCQATTKKGRQCGHNARRGSDYCALHQPGKDRAGEVKNALAVWAVVTGMISFLAVFVVQFGVIGIGNKFFGLQVTFWPLYLYIVIAIGVCVAAFLVYLSLESEHEVDSTERDVEIRRHIDEIGKEAFPDQPHVGWMIKHIDHREDYSFVEVEPTQPRGGWSRLKFVVYFGRGAKPELVGCLAPGEMEGSWQVAFDVPSALDPAQWQRLCFGDAGEPMPIEERERWILRNIQGIGTSRFPENAEVRWALHGMIHKDAYSFVEAEPTPAWAIGWDRVKFVLLMPSGGQSQVVGAYAIIDGTGEIIFEDTDTPSDWKQLHDSPTG